MRSTATSQSALRAPINDILGTPTKVRILRVLTFTQEPLSKRRIATLAKANTSGVSRAIDDLVDKGVVASVGSGPRRLYLLNSSHQLATAITHLFKEERAGFETLVAEIRAVAMAIKPPPISVWIQGGVATKTDKQGDSFVVGVLDSSNTIHKTVEEFQKRVTDIEQEHDVTIQVQGLTKADYGTFSKEAKKELESTTALLGPPILDVLTGTKTRNLKKSMTHTEHDAWALVLSSAVADKLDANPQIIQQAQQYIEDCLKTCSTREEKELIEWKRMLQSMSVPRLKRFLVDESERAIRLRQSSPFVEALSQQEIDALQGLK